MAAKILKLLLLRFRGSRDLPRPYPPITILLTKDGNVTLLAIYLSVFIYDNYTRSRRNGHCRLKMNDTPGNKGRLLKSNDNVRNHSDLNDVVVFAGYVRLTPKTYSSWHSRDSTTKRTCRVCSRVSDSTLVSHSPIYQEHDPTLVSGISHNSMHDVDDRPWDIKRENPRNFVYKPNRRNVI